MNKQALLRIVGITGLIGIGLGAFGAHGLKDFLEEHGKTIAWNKAVLYHLIHLVALLALALGADRLSRKSFALIAWSWLIGIFLFSGSLYALSLTNLGIFGPITPFGGLAFLFGWSILIFTGYREAKV